MPDPSTLFQVFNNPPAPHPLLGVLTRIADALEAQIPKPITVTASRPKAVSLKSLHAQLGLLKPEPELDDLVFTYAPDQQFDVPDIDWELAKELGDGIKTGGFYPLKRSVVEGLGEFRPVEVLTYADEPVLITVQDAETFFGHGFPQHLDYNLDRDLDLPAPWRVLKEEEAKGLGEFRPIEVDTLADGVFIEAGLQEEMIPDYDPRVHLVPRDFDGNGYAHPSPGHWGGPFETCFYRLSPAGLRALGYEA
jgi:hypothetical protein